jgi:ankyrin repeat protein
LSSASWSGNASASARLERGQHGEWELERPRSPARAAQAGDAQLVARLLGEGRDVNEADGSGCTALIMASQKGHVKVVRLLLARKGVEVNKTRQNGATALHIASQQCHVEVVRLLLASKGVEINKSAADGAAALMVAS